MINGYETIGMTPELLAALGEDWSGPVEFRLTRQQNGALDLAFRAYSPPVMSAGPNGTTVVDVPVRRPKGGPRASDH